MFLLSRLFNPGAERVALVPLWHRVVAIAREPQWYRQGGVADTLEGRFDAITLVLSLVLLRLEGEPANAGASARLTELFVEDMDSQMRESGVGDLVVGKKIGKLMSVLGGRLGAYREALAGRGQGLTAAVGRNVSLIEDAGPEAVAAQVRVLVQQLEALPAKTLLSGEIAR